MAVQAADSGSAACLHSGPAVHGPELEKRRRGAARRLFRLVAAEVSEFALAIENHTWVVGGEPMVCPTITFLIGGHVPRLERAYLSTWAIR